MIPNQIKMDCDSEFLGKEEKLEEWVNLVRQRITEKRTFPLQPRTDATFLAKFIRCKKYNVDAAVKAIEKYYDNIHANLRLIEGVRPQDYAPLYSLDTMRLLKHKIDGCSVQFFCIGNWNPKQTSLRDLEIAGSFAFEEMLQDPVAQVHGFISILDLSGLTFAHARQISYHEMKFLMKILLEMFPMRLKSFHLINTPTLFWPIYKVAMKLVPKKMQNRIHFHSENKAVGNVLDPQCLPKSLGGVLEENEAWNDELIPKIVSQNVCYDSYWNGAFGMHRSRRLSRKRSSMMMIS